MASLLLLVSVLFLSCFPWIPDTPNPPEGPQNGYVNHSYEYAASGPFPAGHLVGFRFSWGDGDTSDWADSLPSADTFRLSHAWSDTGTYGVRVQARTTDDRRTDWSSALNVNIDNRAGPFHVVGPGSCYVYDPTRFLAWAEGPAWDSVAFRLNFGGPWDDWSPYVAFGETATLYHEFTQPETVFGYAIAKNGRGSEFDVTESLSVVVSYPPGQLLWMYECSPWLDACAAIDEEGIIYVVGHEGVAALNPDGTARWHEHDAWAYSSIVLGTDGLLFFYGGNAGRRGLVAMECTTGTVRWIYGGEPVWAQTPACGSDGTIYYATHSDSMFAICPDGSRKWAVHVASRASPAIAADGTVYVAGLRDTLHAFNPDGTLRSSSCISNGDCYAMAIGADGTLYCATKARYDGQLLALNPDGSERWRCSIDQNVWSSPVISMDGTIYVNSGGDCLAVSPDGTTKWSFEFGHFGGSTPAIAADGSVIIAPMMEMGTVFGVGPDGQERWRCDLGESLITGIAIGPNGDIYVGSEGNRLYAVKGTAPLADSPWPKFQRDLGNTGRAGP